MTRLTDAAFLGRKSYRSVPVTYNGAGARAAFAQRDIWLQDTNGYRTLEVETSLLFAAEDATLLGLAERTDLSFTAPNGVLSATYRIRQLRAEGDGLFTRAIMAAT